MTPDTKQPVSEKSIVLRIFCDDPDCGMGTVMRFFRDGSHSQLIPGCWHPKYLPERKSIQAAIELEERKNERP